MWSRREEINYALQRNAALAALQKPARLLASDPLDADPLLIKSALHHGLRVDEDCPVCAQAKLFHLNYVFGEQLGQYSGRIKSEAELIEMQCEFGEFRVCVVEVCCECGWNHMISSFLLGDGVKRRAPRRRKTVEDIYG